MTTAVVNFKVDPKIKKEAQAVVERLGFSLSSVLNAYLRNLIRTRTVAFSDDVRLELTPWAKRMLKQSEKDIREGRVLSFTPGEALSHLDTMIADEENRRKHKARAKV